MKLGILVVYQVNPNQEWILDFHLRHLKDTQAVRFQEITIYAATSRLLPKYKEILLREDMVKLVDVPYTNARQGAEHGASLDILVRAAIQDNCDYIATFDVDSWPLRDDWPDICVKRMEDERAIATGVLRAENGDSVLCHPSFTFIDAKAFRDPACKFWIAREHRGQDEIAFFEDNYQVYDTGGSLTYSLHKNNAKWIPLLRTNKKNLHTLLGGIYGDLIFHLGSGSRPLAPFRFERKRLAFRLLAQMGMFREQHPRVFNLFVFRIAYRQIEKITLQGTVNSFDAICLRLKTEEQSFYDFLRS